LDIGFKEKDNQGAKLSNWIAPIFMQTFTLNPNEQNQDYLYHLPRMLKTRGDLYDIFSYGIEPSSQTRPLITTHIHQIWRESSAQRCFISSNNLSADYQSNSILLIQLSIQNWMFSGMNFTFLFANSKCSPQPDFLNFNCSNF
jgi:hypothetical protein